MTSDMTAARHQIREGLARERQLACLLDECRTALKIVACGIHRDSERNACWLTGEALAVHTVESALKAADDYVEMRGKYDPNWKEKDGTVHSAWLIERRTPSPQWLVVDGEIFSWTGDSGKAIRFSRRSDAEQVAAVIGEDAEYITEHSWG